MGRFASRLPTCHGGVGIEFLRNCFTSAFDKSWRLVLCYPSSYMQRWVGYEAWLPKYERVWPIWETKGNHWRLLKLLVGLQELVSEVRIVSLFSYCEHLTAFILPYHKYNVICALDGVSSDGCSFRTIWQHVRGCWICSRVGFSLSIAIFTTVYLCWNGHGLWTVLPRLVPCITDSAWLWMILSYFLESDSLPGGEFFLSSFSPSFYSLMNVHLS